MGLIRIINTEILQFSEQSKIAVLEVRFYNGFRWVSIDFSYILVTFDIFHNISSNLCLIQSIMSLTCVKSQKYAEFTRLVFQSWYKNFDDLTILLLQNALELKPDCSGSASLCRPYRVSSGSLWLALDHPTEGSTELLWITFALDQLWISNLRQSWTGLDHKRAKSANLALRKGSLDRSITTH